MDKTNPNNLLTPVEQDDLQATYADWYREQQSIAVASAGDYAQGEEIWKWAYLYYVRKWRPGQG